MGRCLRGLVPLWADWTAGNSHTASPYTFAAQLPLELLQPARLSQERLFPLSCGLPRAQANSSLCLVERLRIKSGFVLASGSGCKAAPLLSHPESPPRGPRETERRGEGEKVGVDFFSSLRVALLDQKLKAVNIFLICMPPSCWPAKLVS